MPKKRPIHISPYNDKVLFKNQEPENNIFYINAAGISYPDSQYKIMHYHIHCSFQYIISGEGYITHNGITQKVAAGDAFYLSAAKGITYCADKTNPYSKLWFNGNGEFFHAMEKVWGISDTYDIIHIGDNTEIVALFHNIYDILKSGNADNEALMCVTLKLFSRLGAYKKNPGVNKNVYVHDDKHIQIAHEIQRYIDLNLYNIKSTSEIAARFGITERSLYSKFKAEFDISPHNYIRSEKLKCAERMICETNEPLTAISERLGFCSTAYFNECFRNFFGASPGKYRRDFKK